MILRNAKQIEPIEIEEITFKGVKYPVKNLTARWLVHKDLGGEEYVHNHAMRHFTIGPSSEIPLHQHKFVEIIYILSGKLISIDIAEDGKRQDIEVGPGDCWWSPIPEYEGRQRTWRRTRGVFSRSRDRLSGENSQAFAFL